MADLPIRFSPALPGATEASNVTRPANSIATLDFSGVLRQMTNPQGRTLSAGIVAGTIEAAPPPAGATEAADADPTQLEQPELLFPAVDESNASLARSKDEAGASDNGLPENKLPAPNSQGMPEIHAVGRPPSDPHAIDPGRSNTEHAAQIARGDRHAAPAWTIVPILTEGLPAAGRPAIERFGNTLPPGQPTPGNHATRPPLATQPPGSAQPTFPLPHQGLIPGSAMREGVPVANGRSAVPPTGATVPNAISSRHIPTLPVASHAANLGRETGPQGQVPFRAGNPHVQVSAHSPQDGDAANPGPATVALSSPGAVAGKNATPPIQTETSRLPARAAANEIASQAASAPRLPPSVTDAAQPHTSGLPGTMSGAMSAPRLGAGNAAPGDAPAARAMPANPFPQSDAGNAAPRKAVAPATYPGAMTVAVSGSGAQIDHGVPAAGNTDPIKGNTPLPGAVGGVPAETDHFFPHQSEKPTGHATVNPTAIAAQMPTGKPGIPSLTADQASPLSPLATLAEPRQDLPVELPHTLRTGTATLPSSEIARHVSVQIADAARQALNRPVELALNPTELGQVRMSLLKGEGMITVSIIAERVETLDLMRRNIDILAQDLRQIGFDNVSFSFGGQGKGNSRGSQPSPEPDLASGTAPTVSQLAQAVDPQHAKGNLRSSAGLDLRL